MAQEALGDLCKVPMLNGLQGALCCAGLNQGNHDGGLGVEIGVFLQEAIQIVRMHSSQRAVAAQPLA
jgi:hypothetical protein